MHTFHMLIINDFVYALHLFSENKYYSHHIIHRKRCLVNVALVLGSNVEIMV